MGDTRPLRRVGDNDDRKPDNQHLLVPFAGDGPPGAPGDGRADARRENDQAGPDVLATSVQHLREARKYLLSSSEMEKQGQLTQAKVDINKAIEEADKADMRPWKAMLDDVKKQLANPRGGQDWIVVSQQLLQEKKELEGVLNLAVDMRIQAAQLCLIEREPHGAKQYLEQAVKLDPDLVKSAGYKQLQKFIVEFSKGHMETVVDWIKKQGKELLTDGLSGGAGLCVAALFPQRMLLRRLAFGLLTSGCTRYGLRAATGEDADFQKDMMWGSVNYLALSSGARMRQGVTNRLAVAAETGAARSELLAGSALNRWKANAAGIGTSSLIYRGAHNYADIGKIDERTGWTYRGSDALFDTVVGAGTDSIFGASALHLGRTALPFTGRFGTAPLRFGAREFSLAPIGNTFALTTPLYTRFGLRALGSTEPDQALRGFFMPGKKLGELYERPVDRYQYDLDDLLSTMQRPADKGK